MTARAILLAFLLSLGGGVGCAGSAANAPESSEKDSDASDEEKPRRGRVKSKDDVSEKGKSWGGWRWKGKRNDCFFKHDNKCYDSKKKACKAAGCKLDSCEMDDGAPAKVSCEK